jgi:hypothetical protein
MHVGMRLYRLYYMHVETRLYVRVRGTWRGFYVALFVSKYRGVYIACIIGTWSVVYMAWVINMCIDVCMASIIGVWRGSIYCLYRHV